MKYHKIRNVEKSVCTCEQMLAYNFASERYMPFAKKYKAQTCGVHRSEIVFKFVDFCMNEIRTHENIYKKYDLDSIQCALNAGAENYLASDYHIACSYEEVGKMFPAYYL